MLESQSSVEDQALQTAIYKIMESVVISDSERGSENKGGDTEELVKGEKESDQFELDSGQVRN